MKKSFLTLKCSLLLALFFCSLFPPTVSASPNDAYYSGDQTYCDGDYDPPTCYVLNTNAGYTRCIGDTPNPANPCRPANKYDSVPRIETLLPADNATGISTSSNLYLTLGNGGVFNGTGFIYIKKTSDDSIVESIGVNSGALTYTSGSSPYNGTDNRLTINPTSNLPDGISLYVTVDSGALENFVGTSFSGISSKTTWNFTTTADTTAPTRSSTDPADGSTTATIDQDLTITFSENVQKGTGNITIKASSGGATIETIDVTSSQVTISGATVTINPSSDLSYSTGYYINIASTAIKDMATTPNNYAGISNATTWNFTTEANVAPTKVSTSPTDGTTGVAFSANLTITFSENVQKGTGNIIIKKSSDNSIIETIAVSSSQVTISSDTVTIDPSSDLPADTACYVNIDSTAIEDLYDLAYAGISGSTTWNFSTLDNVAPTLSSTVPTDNGAGSSVSANLTATFSENVVEGSSGTIILKRSLDDSTVQSFTIPHASVTSSGATITINPSSNLLTDNGYYITISSDAIEDSVGNTYAGISDSTTWNFTSLDSHDPTALTFSPADNSAGLAISDNLTVTFSENIQVGTGTIYLKKTSGGTTVESYNIASSARISITNDTLTIDPTSDLLTGTSYYVTIPATAIKDFASTPNTYAGITASTDWNFTTESGLDNFFWGGGD